MPTLYIHNPWAETWYDLTDAALRDAEPLAQLWRFLNTARNLMQKALLNSQPPLSRHLFKGLAAQFYPDGTNPDHIHDDVDLGHAGVQLGRTILRMRDSLLIDIVIGGRNYFWARGTEADYTILTWDNLIDITTRNFQDPEVWHRKVTEAQSIFNSFQFLVSPSVAPGVITYSLSGYELLTGPQSAKAKTQTVKTFAISNTGLGVNAVSPTGRYFVRTEDQEVGTYRDKYYYDYRFSPAKKGDYVATDRDPVFGEMSQTGIAPNTFYLGTWYYRPDSPYPFDRGFSLSGTDLEISEAEVSHPVQSIGLPPFVRKYFYGVFAQDGGTVDGPVTSVGNTMPAPTPGYRSVSVGGFGARWRRPEDIGLLHPRPVAYFSHRPSITGDLQGNVTAYSVTPGFPGSVSVALQPYDPMTNLTGYTITTSADISQVIDTVFAIVPTHEFEEPSERGGQAIARIRRSRWSPGARNVSGGPEEKLLYTTWTGAEVFIWVWGGLSDSGFAELVTDLDPDYKYEPAGNAGWTVEFS